MPVAAVEQPPIAPAAPAPVEIVHYPEIPPKVVGGLPYVRDYKRLAMTICRTEMVPRILQGRPDAITACFMAGYELGLGPMQALNSFDIIEGRPALKPEAMRALIMAAGHLFVLGEGTDHVQYAEVTARRSDWPADFPTQTYRYDLGDAAQAGLDQKKNWLKMPRDMLAARATGGAGRRWFADVIAGMSYTTEEVRDFGPDREEASSPAPANSPEIAPSTVSTDAPTPDNSQNVTSEPDPTPPKKAKASTKKAAPKQESPAPEPGSLPLGLQVQEPAPEPAQQPGEAGVTVQMRGALTALISGLPQTDQPLCRAFIRQHFPNGAENLNGTELQKCIDIAAGWPDSAAQHPLPLEVELAAAELEARGRGEQFDPANL